MRGRPKCVLLAASDIQLPTGVGVRWAGYDAELGHGRGAGQCFAAESKGGDLSEILGGDDLAGGMAGHGKAEILGVDANAVVTHADALHAGLFDIDADVRSTGIQAVLQQLLDDRRRPLHDFAGGDLIGDERAQRPNPSVQPPLPWPSGINNTWPVRMRSPTKLFRARRLRMETRLRSATSDNVSPRLMT